MNQNVPALQSYRGIMPDDVLVGGTEDLGGGMVGVEDASGVELQDDESRLRRMEQGDTTAQIGHWLTALTLLGRIADAETLLAPRYSLFDAAAQAEKPVRQRARRKAA